MSNSQAQHFVDFYNRFSGQPSPLGHLQQHGLEMLYHRQVRFIDPAHNLLGIDALNDYLSQLYQQVRSCHFALRDVVGDSDNMVVCWDMRLVHANLNRRGTIEVSGCSHLKWHQGKVIYHHDYFDLGKMLYEQLPLLGRLIRVIKRRLGQ